MENKIPSTSGLVTNSALTAVKNKMVMLVIQSKKHIKIHKLVKLKRNSLVITMMNILLFQSLISLRRSFCCKISTRKCSNKGRF